MVTAVNAIGSSQSFDTSNAVIPRSSDKYINTIVLGGQISNTLYVDSGANFVVRYSNKAGYVLDSIYINGEYSAITTADSISQYTFKNITADSTIKVVYKITTYTITANAGNGGTISPQGVSNVNYGATPNYTITPNTGYLIDSIFVNNNWVNNANNIYTFDTIKSNQTIRVVFKLQTFSVNAIAGNGGSISPQGISTINYGDTPRYSITPNTGYIIDSVLVNNLLVNIVNNNYTFDSVKSNQIIRVVFKLQTYTITSIAGNGGSTSPQGVSNVNYGATPIYTITPNTGYLIDSIFVNNIWINNVNNTYTFDSVKSNQTIRVVFKLQSYIINANAGNGGSISSQGDINVNYGATPTYTITPNTGYQIDSIFVNNNWVNNVNNNYTFDTIKANQTIQVVFKIQTFSISAIAGNGGTISTQGVSYVNYGDTPRYSITPNIGYQIDSIIVNGSKVPNVNNYIFDSVKSNQTIQVVFKLQSYTITANAGNGGSISPQGIYSVNYGATPIYTITPNTGYFIDSIFVNNNWINSLNNTYTFDTIKSNQSIRVVFKLQTYTISSSAGNGGIISFAGDSILNYGTNITYSITPNTGYNIDSLIIDGTAQSNTNYYTFTNISTNHSIQVTFKPIQFIITGFVNASLGKISIIQDTVNYGSTLRVTYQANDGYNLAYILIDNNITVYDSLIGYTFTNIKQNHIITPIFTYITIPSPPTNIIAIGGNGQASVSFTNPINDGGSPIYKYNITTTTGNITASGVTSPIIVTGLTNNTSYRFVVNAINAIGSSSNSDSSNAISSIVNGKYINTFVVGGQISNITYVYNGSSFVVTYTNKTGYVLDSIYINGVYSAEATMDSTTQYTFKNITVDSAIKVVYKISTFNINAIAGNGGNISPHGIINVNYGTTPRYIFTPNTGYQIDSIIINNIKVSNENSITLDSVKSNQTIQVVFKIQTFTISATAGSGGSISPQGVTRVVYGSTPSYSISPNIGFIIDSITLNGNKIPNINNILLDSVKANQILSVTFKLQTFTISSSAGIGGTISFAGDSILNYNANMLYRITPNIGFTIDSLLIDDILQSNTTNYLFNNIASNHRIRVTFKPIQFIIIGGVNANQGTISTTRDTLNYGESIRITYQANSGFKLTYIIVDGVFIYDSLLGYTFKNITQNHSIIALFANNITIPTPPTNIIAIGGNSQATIHFTEPLSNGGATIYKYIISSTTNNITASGIGSPIIVTGLTNGTKYRFIVNAVNTIGSSPNSDTSNAITTSVNGKYINTVVVGGQITNTAYLNEGTNFVVTYTNLNGYVLDSIFINGTYNARITADSVFQYTFKNIRADSAIKIVYKLTTYSITAIAGNGGTISPQGISSVNYGATPSYTFTPNTGYLIDSVLVNNKQVNYLNNNYTFDSIKINKSIRVIFKLQNFTIISSAGTGGSISPQGINNVLYGSTPSFTISPNIGYEIDSIIVNGIKLNNVNYLTLDSIKSIQNIRIVFKPQILTVFASARSGGSISPQGNTAVKFGDKQVYTITPNNDYIIDSIVVNGVKITNSNIVTLDTIKSNLTLIVTFKLKSFTITSKAGLNGKIISEGIVKVNVGASRIYSIIPDEGYLIDSLIIDDIVLFNTNVYIFNDVQSDHFLRATFKLKKFNIVSTAGIGGSISPLDTLIVNYGEKTIYTITANEGYIIDSLIVDGNKIDNAYTYTFGKVIDNHTIHVTFKLKPIIKECPTNKPTPTIIRVANTLQSDITNFSNHKWFLDGIFKDSTKPNSYTPTATGVYTLQGLDSNECASNFSKKYYFSSTCIIPAGRISNAVSIQGNIIDYPNQIIFKWCPDIIQHNLNIKIIDIATGALLMNEFIPANLSTYIINKNKINSINYLIQVLDINGDVLETSDFINK